MNKLRELYKAIIKKLNNFRLLSFIVTCVSLVAAIVSIGLLFIYYYAGDVSKKTESQQPSFVSMGVGGRIMGMIFFIALIFVIGLSIAVIYNLLPSLKNKEKVSPKKLPIILAVVNGGFQVVVLVFSILAIVLESPNTLALYIVTIPFTLLTCVANFLCLVPLLRCVFYQPAVGTKLFPKKQVEEEAKAE